MPFNKERFEKFEKLPEDIKRFLLSKEKETIYEEVTKKYDLIGHAETIKELVRQTLFGELPPSQLASTLKNTLNLDSRVAENTAKEIKIKIFYPLRASLAKFYIESLDVTREEAAKNYEYVDQPKAGEVEVVRLEEEERQIKYRKPKTVPAPETPIPTADIPKTEKEAREKKESAYGQSPIANRQMENNKTENKQVKEPMEKPQPKQASAPDRYREEPSEEEINTHKKFGVPPKKAPPPDGKIINLNNLDGK